MLPYSTKNSRAVFTSPQFNCQYLNDEDRLKHFVYTHQSDTSPYIDWGACSFYPSITKDNITLPSGCSVKQCTNNLQYAQTNNPVRIVCDEEAGDYKWTQDSDDYSYCSERNCK